jgi:hypothetical protein
MIMLRISGISRELMANILPNLRRGPAAIEENIP